MRWQFKDDAPVSFKVVFALMFANWVSVYGASWTIPRWSPIKPDLIHTVPIRFKGGAVYYAQPWLANYFKYGFWAGFVLLGLLFLIARIHRDEMERVS